MRHSTQKERPERCTVRTAGLRLGQILVGRHFRRFPAGLSLVKLGELLVEVAHGGIGRGLRHLPALLSALDMKGAIILRAHLPYPYARRAMAHPEQFSSTL